MSRCRVKQLKEEPYTQREAEAAAGLSTDNEGAERRAKAAMENEVEMAT
jgi:bud site selection protein 20